MSIRKISIITPSLNRVDMLKAAVRSVVAQGYPNYEHIIIDGGSTDGTLEFISTQPQIKFLCEPDRGMYDALNKGLALASGEMIGFLNTDDLYAEGIFKEVIGSFDGENILAVAGEAGVFADDGPVKRGIKLYYSPGEQSLLESTTQSGNYFNAWFFRDRVFDLIGGFDPIYRIAGDREFMLRVALHHIPFKTINKLVYLYRSHVDSLTFDHADIKQRQSTKEILEMTTRYLKYPNLTPIEKRLIVQLHTRESLALARWHERSGNIVEYVSVITDCVRNDPSAVPRVLRHMMRSVFNQSDKLVRHTVGRIRTRP